MSDPKDLPDVPRRCARVLRTVHELHKLGYQRLRVCPRLGSGGYWYVFITPASRVLTTHGAWGPEDGDAARYSVFDGNDYFGWTDAKNDTAADLAMKFRWRFQELCKRASGRDWSYAGWYLDLMWLADRGDLPVSMWDGMPATDPRFLPTLRYVDSGLPMPPGGELPPGGFQPPETRPFDPNAPSHTMRFSNGAEFLANFGDF